MTTKKRDFKWFKKKVCKKLRKKAICKYAESEKKEEKSVTQKTTNYKNKSKLNRGMAFK